MENWIVVDCMNDEFQDKIKDFKLGKKFKFRREQPVYEIFEGTLQKLKDSTRRNFDLGIRSIYSPFYIDINS